MVRMRRARVPKEPKAPVVYEESPDIRAVAERLIRLYPVQFGWTTNFRLAYIVVRGKRLVLTKKEPMGVFKKVPPLYRGLTGFDAVVEILDEAWAMLNAEQQEALIAHELCHGSMSERGALRVEKHDLEEFRFVVAQWGAWDEGIRRFGEQLDLFSARGPLIKTGTAGEQATLEGQEPLEHFRRPLDDEPTPIARGRKPKAAAEPAPVH